MTRSPRSTAPFIGPAGLGDRARRTLDASVARDFRDLIDALPFPILLVDSEHRICLSNQVVGRSSGVDPATLNGAYCPTAIHGLSDPFPGCPLEAAVESGNPEERELRDTESGRWLQSGIFPTLFETPDGKPVFLHSVRDITEAKQATADLRRKVRTHEVLAALLHLSSTDVTIERLFADALGLLLSLDWLSVESSGAAFLRDAESGHLTMIAHRGLSSELVTSCARVAPGFCLCGRAAATGELVYAGNLDHRHDTSYPGIADHGHYCVPIRATGEVLGLVCLYLRAGHGRDPEEEAFLLAVGDGLGGILQHRRTEQVRLRQERQLMQSERLASIGTVAASVVHEIKNPLSYVGANVDFAEGQLRLLAERGIEGLDPVQQLVVCHRLEEARLALADAQAGAERIRVVVRDMRVLSNMNVDRRAAVDLNQVLGACREICALA